LPTSRGIRAIERANYDFARYLAERTRGFDRRFGEVRAVQQAVIPPSLDGGTLALLVSPTATSMIENLFDDVLHAREELVS
jgi:hypothetical protein